jgi:uncharacterized membrane protein HdeD (DUF308 family)
MAMESLRGALHEVPVRLSILVRSLSSTAIFLLTQGTVFIVCGFLLSLDYSTNHRYTVESVVGAGLLFFGCVSIFLAIYFVRRSIRQTHEWLNTPPL